MSEPESIPEVVSNQALGDGPSVAVRHAKSRFLPVLFSTLVPGTGHLLLRQKRKGLLLLAVFLALEVGNWPFRMAGSYWGFTLPIFGFLALFACSSCDALLTPASPEFRVGSKAWLLVVVPVALLSGLLIDCCTFIAVGFRVLDMPSTSMESTIAQNDRIVVDFDYYHRHEPDRGDIVIFLKDDLFVVKRIIAMPGDTIESKDREIKLNGRDLIEPYIEHINPLGKDPQQDTFPPVTVPAGKYFVMGDNRDVSLDSRFPGYGFMTLSNILGKPLYVLKPGKDRTGRNLH